MHADKLPDPDQMHGREWPATPYSIEARAPAPSADDACVIALIGDCTMACTYFPPGNRPENHLAVRIRRAFPNQPFLLRNFATDGESADGFLRPERREQTLGVVPRLDIAFIRFGINDRKRFGISGCLDNLRLLCAALTDHSPNISLFIETGIWVDYPTHYLWNRNSALGPLYLAMQAFAMEQGYAVVDIYRNMEAETTRGNWDLRVRGLPAPEHTIVDSSFDTFFGDDPAFFTNVHPNSRCLGLIADWEIDGLKQRFGAKLPRVESQ